MDGSRDDWITNAVDECHVVVVTRIVVVIVVMEEAVAQVV